MALDRYVITTYGRQKRIRTHHMAAKGQHACPDQHIPPLTWRSDVCRDPDASGREEDRLPDRQHRILAECPICTQWCRVRSKSGRGSPAIEATDGRVTSRDR